MFVNLGTKISWKLQCNCIYNNHDNHIHLQEILLQYFIFWNMNLKELTLMSYF